MSGGATVCRCHAGTRLAATSAPAPHGCCRWARCGMLASHQLLQAARLWPSPLLSHHQTEAPGSTAHRGACWESASGWRQDGTGWLLPLSVLHARAATVAATSSAPPSPSTSPLCSHPHPEPVQWLYPHQPLLPHVAANHPHEARWLAARCRRSKSGGNSTNAPLTFLRPPTVSERVSFRPRHVE